MRKLAFAVPFVLLTAAPPVAATLAWPNGPAPCDDPANLQACVDFAAPGEVIEIAAGSYPGQSVTSSAKSLTLRPAAGAAPVFQSFTSIFFGGGDGDFTNVVEGLTIERGRIAANQGGDGTFDVTFRDNVIQQTSTFNNALSVSSGNTQPPYGPTLFRIENNRVSIDVDPTDVVSAISAVGFQGDGNVGSIVGNVIDQVGGDQAGAIEVIHSVDFTVDIIGNRISGANFNEGIGIDQQGSGTATVRIVNNVISGQVDDAGLPGAITLSVNSTGTGNFTVVNNTVAFNENGLQVRLDEGGVVSGVIANNIFAFNLEDGLDLDPAFEAGVPNEHNLVFGNGSNFFTAGPGTIFEDPRFIAPDDLQLDPSSPARNAGSNARVPGDITTDVLGNARIQADVVDMGAFESPPTAFEIPALETAGFLTLALGLALLALRRLRAG